MPEFSLYFQSYFTWLTGITQNGTTYPRSLDMDKYLVQVRNFKSANKTNPLYGTGAVLSQLKPDALLNVINGSNCK